MIDLSDRDRLVVRVVATLRQATASQLAAICFPDVSRTPLDRSLKRLVKRGYLSLAGRLPSSPKGGAGGIVYRLGAKGFYALNKPGRYLYGAAVSQHTVAVSGIVADFYTKAHQDKIELIKLDTEHHIGGLIADIYVRFRANGLEYAYYLEIDLRSERPKVLKEKCELYIRAWQASTDDYFPNVVFIVPDGYRIREIERAVLNGLTADKRELFKVYSTSDYFDYLVR